MIYLTNDDILNIREIFLKQNKIVIRIKIPVSKYNIIEIYENNRLYRGKIYGIELFESTEIDKIIVTYMSSESIDYE